jgi:uncharacterized protein (DUF169 family)
MRDYSVLKRFKFERRPVGVKYLIEKPKGIKHIDKALNFCEMLGYAHDHDAFYVGPDDWVCVGVEQSILGMKDPEPILVSGLLGGSDNLFKDASSCRAMYQYMPKLPKDSVRYVVFSPLEQLTFDPDLLILTADINQAQSLVRSINFSTGKPFVSMAGPVVACSWMYVYPVVSGELNYYVTGLGLGMQALNIFPPGLFLISVPFQVLPIMLENLEQMPAGRDTTEPGPGGDAHRKRVNALMDELRNRIGSEG